MKTKEIINQINENGGLDINYCKYAAKKDGYSLYRYLREYIKSYYECSNYVADKVARYYL